MKRQVLAQLLSNEEVAPGTHLIWMDAPEIALEGTPGQFVMVDCYGGDGLVLRRPMSIFRFGRSIPGGERLPTQPGSLPKTALSILFRTVGRGTAWLSRRQPGERLDLIGPLGNGFAISPSTRNVLAVAGGVGLAGLAALIDEAAGQEKSVRLLLGFAAAPHAYPREVLPQGAELFLSTEDGSLGTKGLVTDLLKDHAAWADEVFACGPNAMFAAMAGLWARRGLQKPAQVLMEARMGCGLGLCYACSIPTRAGFLRVCTYGPRFALDEVDWQSLESMLGQGGEGRWL